MPCFLKKKAKLMKNDVLKNDNISNDCACLIPRTFKLVTRVNGNLDKFKEDKSHALKAKISSLLSIRAND